MWRAAVHHSYARARWRSRLAGRKQKLTFRQIPVACLPPVLNRVGMRSTPKNSRCRTPWFILGVTSLISRSIVGDLAGLFVVWSSCHPHLA